MTKATKVFRSTEQFEREMFPRATAKSDKVKPNEYARELAAQTVESAVRRATVGNARRRAEAQR